MKKYLFILPVIAIIVLAIAILVIKSEGIKANNANTNNANVQIQAEPVIISSVLYNNEVYFSKYLPDQNYTEFGYVELSGEHQGVVTMMTPDVNDTNAKVFFNQVKITDVKDNTIYFVSDNKFYKMPIIGIGEMGSLPELVSDFK